MKTLSRRRMLSLSTGMAMALAAVSVQAQPASPMTIIDGGYAEQCALAARNPEAMPRVVITGSRTPVSPIRLCTIAIQEGGDRASRAASYNNRGVLHFASGDNDAALADFTEAVRLDDSLVFAHINRGNIFNLREQWEQAISAFDRAIELGVQPVLKRVRFRTLGCYPLSGAIESAAETLQDVIDEMRQSRSSERQGRLIDHDQAASMERKKQEGYF